jgi:hypothetical protein
VFIDIGRNSLLLVDIWSKYLNVLRLVSQYEVKLINVLSWCQSQSHYLAHNPHYFEQLLPHYPHYSEQRPHNHALGSSQNTFSGGNLRIMSLLLPVVTSLCSFLGGGPRGGLQICFRF